ncbi:MAG: hypothetical protein IKU37_02365 [Candidatus Gastranaerophilales bacterium]|nr:hypothetical protein [Candidatus Gastranaerophilales bacterium]
MCTPGAIVSNASSSLLGGIFKGVGVLGSVVSTVSDYKTNKDNNEYRMQVALNNAKIAQNEALRQKQLGIEKARREKISGLQEISRLQAKNSASNLDMSSYTNKIAYQDVLNFYDTNSQTAKSQYDLQANNYFNQANSYLNQAQIYKNQYNQSIFDYSLNALGKFNRVAADWYKNGEER